MSEVTYYYTSDPYSFEPETVNREAGPDSEEVCIEIGDTPNDTLINLWDLVNTHFTLDSGPPNLLAAGILKYGAVKRALVEDGLLPEDCYNEDITPWDRDSLGIFGEPTDEEGLDMHYFCSVIGAALGIDTGQLQADILQVGYFHQHFTFSFDGKSVKM